MILHFTELYPLNKGKPARARKTDPSTSHKAAERTEANSVTQQQRATIYAAVMALGGATNKELARHTGIAYEDIKRRTSEVNGLYQTDDEREGCKVWRIHNA